MDSQMNSELLNKILEDDIILLSSCESDIDLLGPDLDVELEERLDTIKIIFHYSQTKGWPTNPPR